MTQINDDDIYTMVQPPNFKYSLCIVGYVRPQSIDKK